MTDIPALLERLKDAQNNLNYQIRQAASIGLKVEVRYYELSGSPVVTLEVGP